MFSSAFSRRPVGDRVRAVLHGLGFAIRRGDRAGVQVIAADDDGRLELAARHHVVEREAEPMAIAQAHPADARRQSLELDACLRHVEPVMQVLVVGQQLFHLRIGLGDVFGIARQRHPAKRARRRDRTAAGYTPARSPGNRRRSSRLPRAPPGGCCCRSRRWARRPSGNPAWRARARPSRPWPPWPRSRIAGALLQPLLDRPADG